MVLRSDHIYTLSYYECTRLGATGPCFVILKYHKRLSWRNHQMTVAWQTCRLRRCEYRLRPLMRCGSIYLIYRVALGMIFVCGKRQCVVFCSAHGAELFSPQRNTHGWCLLRPLRLPQTHTCRVKLPADYGIDTFHT